MVRTKANEHKYCREAFEKSEGDFENRMLRIQLQAYALFYKGFRTGINYQKKLTSLRKTTEE